MTLSLALLFLLMPVVLPFALSSCSGGSFCAATTGHNEATSGCSSHEETHLAIVAQFGKCTPQQSVGIVMFFISLIAASIVWTMRQRFARTFLGLHTAHLNAVEAPGFLTHIRPFDPLTLAFARGNIQSRRSTHIFAI